MGYQALLDAVRALPVEDQRRLVDVIGTELTSHLNELGLTAAQLREIKRRSAAYDADPSVAIPWAKVEAGIDQQLKELGE